MSLRRRSRLRLLDLVGRISRNQIGLAGAWESVTVEVVERGEQRDFDAVYAAHYVPLVRLAYLTTGNLAAAEDLVQDVFVEWYRRHDQVRAPAAYLRRAVVSRCTSWVRRRMLERRHRGQDRDQPPPVGSPNPDGPAVRAALARLHPRQRAAVFLRYYLDLPEAEIAAALGCRPGTVKSLLHRSLSTLREQLREH